MTKTFLNKISKEFSFSYAKSSGPGGQHVNTTDTKVILNWDYEQSSILSDTQKQLITSKLQNHINKENEFYISSSKTRNRIRNQEDCINKALTLIEKAFFKTKKRKKTKPSRASIKKRLDSKKKHSDQKKTRKKVVF